MTPEHFIRKICHDLRAPLRALKEMPNWLEEDLSELFPQTPEHIIETTRMLKTQATRLDEMLSGLAQLARLHRSHTAPRADISQIFQEADWPEGLNFETDLQHLAMEPEHANLIFHHLIENAFRHGEAAKTGAQLSARQYTDHQKITIEDAGPGIEREELEHVFDPLTTLKPRDDVEGSGMGLAIVARIAELYGGRARAYLPKGGGLGIDVALPMAQGSNA